jgi:GDPmannose 4,6-dehydratase
MKTALITGVGGQDGSYLAAHLLAEGYKVVGTSRDAAADRFDGLRALGIRDEITIRSMSLVDFRSTIRVVAEEAPDEIYNLAGQTCPP